MARPYPIRQYIVFDAERLLGRPVDQERLELGEVERVLRDALERELDFQVVSLPTARFVPSERLELPDVPHNGLQRVAVLVSANPAEAQRLRDAIEKLIREEGGKIVSAIGADVAFGAADYSFPGSVEDGFFGTRFDAHRLIGIEPPLAGLDLTGQDVNVVIVDAGLDRTLIPAGQWGGGWQLAGGRAPGTTTGKFALHASMIVQNILRVAPLARIWDVPIIPPPRINNLNAFLADAQVVFATIIQDIQLLQNLPGLQQWIFMNAWAIYDRRSEVPLGDYTENRPGQPGSHPFITLIEQLAQQRFDIIFCAGNCGGICPDGRCGPNDYGPGRDIWGANAHPSVLTVGATRLDNSWIGYSSEGPGPCVKLASQKPDLCAPSQFVEMGYPSNVGTSAASALAAGVVTAFRSTWPQNVVSPARLINQLNVTARHVNGPIWTRRYGFGILDAQAAAAALP